MPRNDDPMWCSNAVRAALQWIATGLVAAICAVLWEDHESQAETRLQLALVRQEVAGLSQSVAEIRTAVLGRVASHGTKPSPSHP